MKPRFITFEGGDGCGKSTQIRLAADWLKSLGGDVLTTFEPGDHSLGADIRSILLSGTHTPVPEAELLLFLADRAQHMRELILPALNKGQWVLCDRFTDSTLAYQMAGRQLDAENMQGLVDFAEMGMRPALTLWVDLPVREALARTRSRAAGGEETTRMDEEALSFHERVRDGFESLCRQSPERIFRVDAHGEVDAVQQRVRTVISDCFELNL